jgi:hypothetical protein
MMSSSGFASGGFQSIGYLTGLSADELANYSTDLEQAQFFNNSLLPTNQTINNYLWQEGYRILYQANAVIEGLSASGLDSVTKSSLIGEVRFIRAFSNFYLTNLFGEIPQVTTTDYLINNSLIRSSRMDIQKGMLDDLAAAQHQLAEFYPSPTGTPTEDRIRPNKYAATALQARLFLYIGDWQAAEAASTILINKSDTYSLCQDLNQVFLKNSAETIWQLKPVMPGTNTNDARAYILNGPPNNAALSDELLNGFETGDRRRLAWIDSVSNGTSWYYFPFKYKAVTNNDLAEYQMVLRLAEQYLIRAEARAHLDDISGSQNDLNVIRNRAGLPNTTATDQASLLLAIEHERQIELFTEWGHRWFDLKRTGRSTAVLEPLKSPNWQVTDTLFPIPRIEITNNPKLTQNPGY